MNGLHPHRFPELFECIILGTDRSPGVVKLSGHDRDEKWDSQKGSGQEGSTDKLNGADPGEFTATFYLAADSDGDDGHNDFTRWDMFQDTIESTVRGPTPKALPVYHPDLARNGFTHVVKKSIGGFVWDDRGGATVVVVFKEYRPPKPKPAAKAKPTTSANTPAKPAKPDPNAKAKAKLAELTQKAKKP